MPIQRASEALSESPTQSPGAAFEFSQVGVGATRAPLDAFIRRRLGIVSAALWLLLVTVYQVDDSVIEEGDAIANVELPIALLRTGKLHFTPRLTPIVFRWRSFAPLPEREDFYVRSWRERHNQRAAGYWLATGQLRMNGPRYFVVKSPLHDVYTCTFGVIAGLSMLPLTAALAALHPDFVRNEWLKLSAAKLHASGLVGLSAVFLFWIALRFVRPWQAVTITLAYALGTCVWSISSETLWQQTVNIALLSAAAYQFVRIMLDDAPRARVFCGLLLGAAAASRPTAAFFLLTIGLYLFKYRRQALISVLIAASIVPFAIAVYNQQYFGSPINFAQEMAGHKIALEKTGTQHIWQTPLYIGLAGLLLSPSRGLLVFSPFLALSFWGAWRTFRQDQYLCLRPLVLAAAGTMLVQCKWFDWWGGWSFGYRPWLEAVPVLALCLIPMIGPVFENRLKLSVFCVALAWSVFVQYLGAFAYDKYWNARDLHRVAQGERSTFFVSEPEARSYAQTSGGAYTGLFKCNIDLPVCRYRLWSVDDNIIGFYMGERFQVAREHRMRAGLGRLFASQ